MPFKKILALAVTGAGLMGCETSNLTSPYAFPSPGVVYKYGNFCGPGVPTRASEDPLVQLSILDSLVPADHIDAICREHDRCYEVNGRDNPGCDYAVIGALRYYADRTVNDAPTGAPLQQDLACLNLAGEILSPFSTKYASGGSLQSTTSESAVQSGNGETGIGTSLLTAGLSGLGAQLSGYPSAPGTCLASSVEALQSNFFCHYEYYDQKTTLEGEAGALALSTLPENGCADATKAMFDGAS